jgi:hypothetical protein
VDERHDVTDAWWEGYWPHKPIVRFRERRLPTWKICLISNLKFRMVRVLHIQNAIFAFHTLHLQHHVLHLIHARSPSHQMDQVSATCPEKNRYNPTSSILAPSQYFSPRRRWVSFLYVSSGDFLTDREIAKRLSKRSAGSLTAQRNSWAWDGREFGSGNSHPNVFNE